ncbi:MAG: riboflavin biosynthesis protein RibF [Bacteroidales bacterium]
MKVSTIFEAPPLRRPVMTIGIFDGVHLGHRFMLHQLRQEADRHDGEAVVVTLWPHPRLVLQKDLQGFRLLHSMEEKTRALEACGMDHLVVVPFTREVASLTACDFVQNYLVERLGVEVLMLGYDNRFGSDRNGDPDGLQQCACEHQFRIQKLPEHRHGKEGISSSIIRDLIWNGAVAEASKKLGYEYSLEGDVVEGNQVGRQIGFPTANIHPGEPYKLIPMNGVYAIRALLDGVEHTGMLNIGFRPTLDSDSPVKTIEAHLFGVSGDFYGKKMDIRFVHRLRDEMKFQGLEALRQQLERDRETACKLLGV